MTKAKIHCDPRRCGLGCTERDFLRAVKCAEALARRLGAGWKPSTWENLGWHYQAVSSCGRLHVSARYYGGYMAFLNESGRGGGRWVGDGTTAKKAVKSVIQKALQEKMYIEAILEGLEVE